MSFLLFFASSLKAEDTIFIDMRLLISVHPLFDVFDVKTNRFKGTSSEFIDGGWEGVEAEIEKIKKRQDELLKSPEILKEKLKNVPISDRLKIEREYMLKKQIAEEELKSMKLRVHNARQFPEVMGRTIDNSIMTQINQIVIDIRSVILDLKNKYKAKTIIDISDLLPLNNERYVKNSLLVSNLHRSLWKKTNMLTYNQMQDWIKEASEYWAKTLGVDADIIPFGALDVRLESIKMLEERVKGIIK